MSRLSNDPTVAAEARQIIQASGGGQGVAVTNAAAATAVNPAAPAAYVAHAPGAVAVTSNAATDLDTTAAALQALRDEVALYEAEISALIVDVANIRTQFNALLASLRTAGHIST